MTKTRPELPVFLEVTAAPAPRPLGGAARAVAAHVVAAALALGGVACSDVEETRVLAPSRLGLTESDTPIYDDGELTIFESKVGIQFPLLAPTGEQRGELARAALEPYPRHPWVEVDDLRVQVSWLVSNLDPEPHVVGVLIDPWNEFGKYWPGMSLVDADNGEYLPNLSGYDRLVEVPGTGAGKGSRVSGTATYEDMREMAVDFATVMQLILTPPSDGEGFEDADVLALHANHAFHKQNRSGASPLVDPYRPEVIAGLTGVDIGLRTFEPANVAIEVVVELVRVDGASPVPSRDDERDQPLLREPADYITVGSAP